MESHTFSNTAERCSEVDIIQETKIGSGVFGDIYRAVVRVHDKNGNYRDKNLVIKKFKEDSIDSAKHAFENYAALQAAGVRTWTTYRLEKDKGIILMTDGEAEQDYLITYNNESNSKREIQHKVTEIANFDEAINSAMDIAINAADNCILLAKLENLNCADSWMVRFSKRGHDGSFDLDCFVGDLDSIDLTYLPQKESAEEEAKAILAYHNVESLKLAMLSILKEVLSPDVKQKYCDVLMAKMTERQAYLSNKTHNYRK